MFVAIKKKVTNRLRVVPVIDILNGIVVHAVRGIRKEYLPLKSIICSSSDPVDVAAALKGLGFVELYIADLDAITGGQQNLSLLKQIVDKTCFELMVDAGVSNLEKTILLNSYVSKLVIGTETLQSTSFVAEAVEHFGSERVMVSLDLMGNEILSGFSLGKLAKPLKLLRELEVLGVSQIIVLDLARVGSRKGVNIAFLKEVVANIRAKVFVGGGVRDVKDLLDLKDAGVSGALVATALYSGRISPYEMKQVGLL